MPSTAEQARAQAALQEYTAQTPPAAAPSDEDLARLGRAAMHLDRAERALGLGDEALAGSAWLEADELLRGLEQSVRERLGARHHAEAERRTEIARRLSAKPPTREPAAP